MAECGQGVWDKNVEQNLEEMHNFEEKSFEEMQ